MQNAALVPYDDMIRMATAIHKSGMFNLKTPEAGISLFLLAQAEGLHPMTAMRRFHILSDGRASMRADAMLADFRTKVGGRVRWIEHTATAAVGLWKVDDYEERIGYTIEEARAAGYIKPGSGWMKDPGAMLRARCISRAIRMMAPEVVAGLYTPEELSDGDWAPTAPTQTSLVVPAKAVEAPKALEKEIDKRPWSEVLGGREVDAVAHLRVMGWLKPGEGLDQLKDGHHNRIRKNPEAFLMHMDKAYRANAAPQAEVPTDALSAAQKAVRDVLGGQE